jgi:hypothetical protein
MVLPCKWSGLGAPVLSFTKQEGVADLGIDLEQHIAFCIEAMKGIAGELGLAGV